MDLVGTKLGQYQVIRKIGKGGMGDVFEALDTALHRRVAIKIINRKYRFDDEAKNRFQREAQILSKIDNPHICRVYEFIATKDCDCLVVELIDGRPLETVLSDGLEAAQKLSVARQLLEAVESAHKLGIVHRDLKPGNLMVTSSGLVKVLDFGVARMSDEPDPAIPLTRWPEEDTEITEALNDALETKLGTIVGTPRYMSPEQAKGEGASAASDIYSLGLVFQWLFTERSPYPEPASSVGLLWRVMNAETVPVVGLDSDLTLLIETMTQVRPDLRPSAREAIDRLNWIRDRPKRRLLRWSVTVVVLLLSAATLISSYAYMMANRARNEVRRALAQTEAVNDFLEDMLSAASPERKGRDVKMIDLLDDAYVQVDSIKTDQPEIAAGVLDTLGTTYYNIGELSKALDCFSRSVKIHGDLDEPKSEAALASSHNLANVLLDLGRVEEAEELQAEVYANRRSELGDADVSTIQALNLYALILNSRGQFEEAERLWRKGLQDAEGVEDLESVDRLVMRENLALSLMSQYRFADAEPILRQSLVEKTESLGADHPRTYDAMNNLAATLMRVGSVDEALHLQRRVFESELDRLGEKHPNTLNSMSNLIDVLSRAGHYDEAEAFVIRCNGLAVQVFGAEHPFTVYGPCRAAFVEMRRGNLTAAAELNQTGVDGLKVVVGSDHPFVVNQMRIQARIYRELGDLDRAIAELNQLLDHSKNALGKQHVMTRGVARDLAFSLRETDDVAKADRLTIEYAPFYPDPD